MIPMKALQHSINVIAPVLSNLINFSFYTGSFPSLMKIARVTQIFKSDDPKNLANYRPISLLPVFSNIYEKLIYKKMLSFCLQHNITFQHQYGFLPKLNTTLGAIDAVNYITFCQNFLCYIYYFQTVV